MRKLVLLSLLFIFSAGLVLAQEKEIKEKPKVDYRIDNMGYWKRMAAQGLVPVAPKTLPAKAVYKGSKIDAKSVLTDDSPDVPVSETGNDTQSENSIFVDPNDNSKVLNSNNSTTWSGGSVGSVLGANYFNSNDYGENWTGSIQGAGGGNSGDPAALIGLDGRHYIGFIHSNYGQGVSYSTDGYNWTSVLAGANDGYMNDKNHLWLDNSPISPYEGNVYDAWTDFSGGNDSRIEFVRSIDGGLTYSSPINVSSASNGYLHQGVNINSGPNGEVYVIWTIYDNSSLNEDAIGFAKSLNGGVSFSPAVRIIDNTYGIRSAGVSKNQRVNSFPSMAVDISGGSYDGTIYVVWTNIGVPGTNTGTNRSIYLIKSEDQGATWSTPIRVNQGPNTNGKEAYFPWITCDPESGVLSVIFYDDRDVTSTQAEAWVANSYDGGETWEDFRVSDVAFTPSPIPGLAGGYMGDYLGISARGGMVYPVWCDNRNGYVQTFVSPFETNNRAKPSDLVINLTEASGQTDLSWAYSEAKTMQYFVVYRDNVQIGTTTETNFTDMLPDYGVYTYGVTAMHEDGESSAVRGSIQWGHPNISVNPENINVSLFPNQTTTRTLTVTNTGELDLTYNLATAITSKGKSTPKDYCAASGGGDEYISGVVFGSINNTGTGANGYADYTAMSTDVDAGNTYPITVTNGNVYSSDDLGVWIDWNQDEDFEDAGENVVCEVSNSGQGTYNIFVPDGALGGSTRMRIRIKWSGEDCGSPCGTTSYGEVEDYTINVNSWLQLGTYTGTVAPGVSEQIDVNFNSEDLLEGVYTATISINSNDLDTPTLDVPITLTVLEDLSLQINPTADDYDVCIGSSTILHANAEGGTGTYTYSWTSIPEGFTSTDANPEVSITENTIFVLAANDGTETETSQLEIIALELPIVNLQPFPNVDESAPGFVLTGGTPPGGTYTGTGVSNGMFYPGVAGLGTHTITYSYTNSYGCDNFAEQSITVADISGIDMLNNGIRVEMYPNPNSGVLFLNIRSIVAKELTVTIMNEVGRIVLKTEVMTDNQEVHQIDLSQLASGIYFVNIKGEMVQIINKLSLQK